MLIVPRTFGLGCQWTIVVPFPNKLERILMHHLLRFPAAAALVTPCYGLYRVARNSFYWDVIAG